MVMIYCRIKYHNPEVKSKPPAPQMLSGHLLFLIFYSLYILLYWAGTHTFDLIVANILKGVENNTTNHSFLQTLLRCTMDYSQGGAEGVGIFMLLVYLVIIVVLVAAYWKLFEKAGKPGWAAIIPIYNIIVMLEIVGRPVWWIILLLIPCVNIVVGIMLTIDIAKSYGKEIGFAIGMILLPIIFVPILAFSGDTQYVGPAAAPQGPPPPGAAPGGPPQA